MSFDKSESLDESIKALEDAGLIINRWDKKQQDFVPCPTPLGAAIKRFMAEHNNRLPRTNRDNKLVDRYWREYEKRDTKTCPKCGGSNWWPVVEGDQYFDHWCEDCDFK